MHRETLLALSALFRPTGKLHAGGIPGCVLIPEDTGPTHQQPPPLQQARQSVAPTTVAPAVQHQGSPSMHGPFDVAVKAGFAARKAEGASQPYFGLAT